MAVKTSDQVSCWNSNNSHDKAVSEPTAQNNNITLRQQNLSNFQQNTTIKQIV